MESGTLAQWLAAVGTIGAVLVALFKDPFDRWRRKPELGLCFRPYPPDCQKGVVVMPNGDRGDCYYPRLLVKNSGRTRAEHVQVFAEKLMRRGSDQSFKDVEGFLPMNLRWTHDQGPPGRPEIFAHGISPEMGKHCELGHVLDPPLRVRIDGPENSPISKPDTTILCLALEVITSTTTHLIFPGEYRLQLRVAAANAKPITSMVEITNTGDWFTEENKMFTDGLRITTH